ncbi:MAG: cofactor-independent phosphoglycerate mutase [Bacteroidales bacterium]|nr:cofactor-independent phosphoglycerate mutase [Bacteroidales bacterium]MBR6311302.1 cofactor-independent phosphoglycerate mutase [Paludibacteraceae bacterium]
MKHIIILGDGMADEPIAKLNGKTPLQVANTPAFDTIARLGRSGMFSTVPDGFHPGSEIANLTVLGYDVRKVFEGRGSLEAASMGIDILPGEMAMRCNLICIENGKIKNHSAGHISTEEADELIKYLNEKLGDEQISFYTGVSYRHLMKMKGGEKHLNCTPPHDVPGTPFKDVMIRAENNDAEATAKRLNELTLLSQKILSEHPINKKRAAEGKDMANSIWLWSPGYKPQMKTMQELYGIKNGVVISAVDLIKGIGVYAGLKPIEVEGATGLFDTNYEGKAAAAIEALKSNDFVYLHVEASDEAGHEGDIDLKIKTIEYLDSRITQPILEYAKKCGEEISIAVLPDHPTPCLKRTHTNAAIPFVIYNPHLQPDEVQVYDETAAQKGYYGTVSGDGFIKIFLE